MAFLLTACQKSHTRDRSFAIVYFHCTNSFMKKGKSITIWILNDFSLQI